MATREQLFKSLDRCIGMRLAVPGEAPPRLVRANSAFSKRRLSGDVVVDVEGDRSVHGRNVAIHVGA